MERGTIESTVDRKQAEEQAEILDRVAQILQEAQLSLPLPSQKEIAELRKGGPLSKEAYLLGLYQRVILSAENAASDLRTGTDPDTLEKLDRIRLSVVEINAIEAAFQERRRKAPEPMPSGKTEDGQRS